jgi:acyl-CoA synthetase (AMP-forming)/AMP-acid ligase II
VEVLSEEPLTIRFVGRKHEWFNVAGYRVDPIRLETIACLHPFVSQARFYGVPNSVTENLVGCELVAKPGQEGLDIDAWKQWFADRVERYEMPRMVKLVAAIEITESGKVKRSEK